MAALGTVTCEICSKKHEGNIHDYRHVCYECYNTESETNKRNWLDKFRGKNNIEERIVKIENWIYDYEHADHRDPMGIPLC